MKRYLWVIGFLISVLGVSTNAQAQQLKTIPCDQIKFKASIPFQKCDYQFSPGNNREFWTGAFHDDNSSAFVAVDTSRNGMSMKLQNGMKLQDGKSYATDAFAYKVFFDKYPNPSDLVEKGKWLSFPAIVIAGQNKRKMNCLQFFKAGPLTATYLYRWTSIAALCVNSGEVPESAADLVLESLEVNIK